MYIVAIAWLYVTLMMAITEDSIFSGLVTFVMYGLFPCSIVMYLMGSPARKRALKLKEQQEFEAQKKLQEESVNSADSVEKT